MYKKPKSQQLLSQLTWDDVYEKQSILVSNRITELRKILRKWDQSHKKIQDIAKTDPALMMMYLHRIAAYTSQTRYYKFKENRNIHDQMIKELDDIDEAFINFKLFDQSNWSLILSEETAQQIENQIHNEQTLKVLFTKISLYLQGYIPINSSISENQNFLTEVGSSQWSSSKYYFQVFDGHDGRQFCWLLSIGYQKLPKLQFNKSTVSIMVYSPFIQIIKIFPQRPDKKNIDEVLKINQKLYRSSPSKNLSEEKLQEDCENKYKFGKKISFFNYQKLQGDQEKQIIHKYHPLIFQPKKCLQQQEYDQYVFQFNSYKAVKKSLEIKHLYNKQIKEKQKYCQPARNQNYKKIFQFNSSKQLINIYDQIPNKKYKLTQDQKKIVTFDTNMIVIGRSGTGKTLCALLRLFVIEFFFKARQAIKLNGEKKSLQAADIDRFIGLKNVFVTASLYLINQIKKQYNQMIQHIKAILLQKNLKKSKQNQQNYNQEIINQKEDINYGSQFMANEFENPTLDDMIEEFKQKNQRIKSLNDLNEKDFPGFFSIRNFVNLVDGTLQNPFLSDHKVQNQALGQAQKQRQNFQRDKLFKEQIQNVGWIEEERKEEINIQKLNRENQRKIEVTYEVFSKQFWPDVPKSYFKVQKQLTPANIWSQIYSVIKGSYISHKSHTKYLSKAQYLALTKKQIEQEYEYKKVAYRVFQYYENWKLRTNHYDFMDLVNNILSDIFIYGYQGPLINYLFIDEVQDLPPATIYLLSSIVTNGVFYCGDSAQTIAKGVNFKFGDIPQMFHQKFSLEKVDLKMPVNNQLTVNFRSQNQILQLGNSIISIIQKLFPGSIDKLKSQTSCFRGPIPIVLNEINELKLLNLLTPQIINPKQFNALDLAEYKLNAPDGKLFKLGPEQIILVRNEEEKNLLPYRLKQGVVLTFEDVKGLEYDDVVLVNFFSSSKYSDKWKLLQYIDIEYSYVGKNQFEQSLKPTENMTGHHLEDDKSVPRTFNWENNMPNLVYRNGTYCYQIPKILISKEIQGENLNQFYELLTELKILYTAITRARKFFIIYEPHLPKYLENIWLKLKIIRKIDCLKQYQTIKDELFQYRKIHKNKSFEKIQKKWINQGFKWYLRKNYLQAIRCFKNINDMKTAKKIQAEMIANEALAQLRRIKYQLKNPDYISKQQFKIKKKILQSSKDQLNLKFTQAASFFEEIILYKNAGQCYYSGQNFKKALQCFQKINFIRGCAQSSKNLKLYEKAGYYYEKLGEFQNMLECYIKSKNFQKVQESLMRNIDKISQSSNDCLKYYKIILQTKVKNYLSQQEQIEKIQAAKIHTSNVEFSKNQVQMIITGYFLTESKFNRQSLLELKTKISLKQAKISQKKKELQQIKAQITLIDEQFCKKEPYKNIEFGRNFFHLWKQQTIYKKDKNFSEACKNENLRYQDAINLVNNYRQIQDYIDKIEDKKLQLTQQLTQYQLQFDQIIIRKKQISDFESQYQTKIEQKYFKKCQQYSEQLSLSDDDQNHISLIIPFSSYLKSDQILSLLHNDSNNSILKFSQFKHNHFIQQTKSVVDNMKDYVKSQMKPPFTDQHHFLIDAQISKKIASHSKNFQQTILLLRLVERIGQDQLALIICDHFQFYDLAKRFIVSKIVKLNKNYDKSKKLTKPPFLSNKLKKKSQQSIQKFIQKINPNFLNRDCFKTSSTSQKIIETVVDTLLMNGLYKNTLQYFNKQSQEKIDISYAFMDYKSLSKCVFEFFGGKNQIGEYCFLSEKQYGRQAKLLNQSSIQQIYFIYDSIQQNSFLTDTNWKDSVILSDNQALLISIQIQNQTRIQQKKVLSMKLKLKDFKKHLHDDFPQNNQKARNDFQGPQRQKQIQTMINELQKQIKKQQKVLGQLQNNLRKQLFSLKQKQIINNNKQEYKNFIRQKLKRCKKIPSQYQNGYFSIFMELRDQNLAQKAVTYEFKKNLKKCIQNSSKDLKKLSTFQQCQIIVLYLSIICYIQKNDIFQYLKQQGRVQKNNQKHQIDKKIYHCKNQIKRINDLKDKKQGGYYEKNQEEQIKKHNNRILELQFAYNNVENNQIVYRSTFDTLKELTEKMLKMISNLSSSDDFWFIELMMGFFQCRIVRDIPKLWFLGSDYVIVRSNSVLVKELLLSKFQAHFCYYIDNNKQFIIMKFIKAYTIMIKLIQQKHKTFIGSYFKKDLDRVTQVTAPTRAHSNFIIKHIQDFGITKIDQIGYQMAILSNGKFKSYQIKQNYKMFTDKIIQVKMKTYKESILCYYYENGFKSTETFHFIQHQLKVLDEMLKILVECENFSNIMIKSLSKNLTNLQAQFEKWKNFVSKNKEITHKSCENDEDEEEQFTY